MTDYNFKGLVTITKLAALRHFAGVNCATEQGIRAQIRLKKENPSADMGFDIVNGPGKQEFLKITDKKLDSYREKLESWLAKNPFQNNYLPINYD